MNRKASYITLGVSAILAASAIALLFLKNQKENTIAKQDNEITIEEKQEKTPIPGIDKPNNYDKPENSTTEPKPIYSANNPAELLAQIANALEKDDIESAKKLIGDGVMNADTIAKLNELAKKGKLRPRTPNSVREVGELELNRRTRWAIELEEQNKATSRILFDLRKEGDQWIIENMILPSDNNQSNDALTIADTFLQAVLIQDFDTALNYVDSSTVSHAKIAALCILFEEGEYRMKSSKPLRAMFSREDIVGYIANVETTTGQASAQFAINLRLTQDKWLISEINLDKLLAEYADRFADGDIYYSPLVKNPTGGETLALYFEFDEDSMSKRTSRQLEIVAAILIKDPTKKITLSGHADAKGTKDYNDNLSSNRASVVRDFLIAAGVPSTQITTIAKGASQPRRPNVTETGEDDPQGRRANRRTEIYLDF